MGKLDLDTLNLESGGHDPDGKFCVMEAVAFLANEPWSAAPKCAGPVLGAFCRSWNDSLNDADRNRLLKPYIMRLVDAAGTPAIEERRGWMAFDWLVRVHTATWMGLTDSLKPHAEALRALPEITDKITLNTCKDVLAAARDAAGAAAGAAAGDAAGGAAWAAAWAAAGDAAWAAAGAAARDAALAAADKQLCPTVELLQQSACELLDRMIALRGTQ